VGLATTAPMSQQDFMQLMNLTTHNTKTAYQKSFSFAMPKKYTSMIAMRIWRILLLEKNL